MLTKSTNPERQNWRTPKDLMRSIDEMAEFDLDVCADFKGRIQNIFTKEDNGLKKKWFFSDKIRNVWCNPPFKEMGAWLYKAGVEVEDSPYGAVWVMAPVDPSTSWWQTYATQAAEIWFLTPRVKFEPPNKTINGKNGPAGAHCLLVYRHLPEKATRQQSIINWRWK